MGSDSVHLRLQYNTDAQGFTVFQWHMCFYIFEGPYFSEKKAFYVDGVCYMHKAINKAASLTYIQCIQFRSKNYFLGEVRQSFIA